ncbi:MAG: KinB signaling pathway activation protein [Thermobacillus sp. ZCTH02-B1]|uniref:KinB-signaling pathway activation protein n=1 Tax=Thermobacillus sp. ZCTH02-B1 TaxID=1858795 RepID=UPI000B555F9B|nr:KinB-signaling pathway activation protein [Thermobacillus sp. ZCTH02-B1]OUM95087.1 MAG: KinB signaling pathway activation protein [Thermobacillus sp. ZCTH02-B1]
MTLRKWFFLFWSCMAVGGAVAVAAGLVMQWTDPDFGFLGIGASGFNAWMMLLSGLLIGVFSQMGFFAYLTLNYIALGIFRKAYLWNTLQAYTTAFMILLFGYLLYERRADLGNVLFWLLPLLLAAGAWAVGVVKVRMTNRSALIPTLFLMVAGTVLEAWPGLNAENGGASSVIFMLLPLFACNAYQILMLHRLVKPEGTGSAHSANPAS